MYYTGITQNYKIRLSLHNNGKVKHTSKHAPWELNLLIWFSEPKKAFHFEKYLKSGSGRAFTKRHF